MQNSTIEAIMTTPSTNDLTSLSMSTSASPNISTLTSTETSDQVGVPKRLTIDDLLRQYWEYNMAYDLGRYGYPVIIILGTIGNFLILMIMFRERMRRRTTCFYMSAVALFDTLVLYFACLRQWLALLQGTDALTLSSAACKTLNFFSYTSFDISAWLLVIMTVERFIVVQFPLQAAKMSSIPRARAAVLILIVAMTLLNSHFFWTVHLDERGRCNYLEEFEHFHDNIWPWIDATVYSFLPFLSLLIFNILIIVIHKRSLTFRRTTLHINKPRTSNGNRSNQGTQLRLTAMLLMVTFTFLLLSAPNVILICVRHRYFDFSAQVDDLRDVAIYRLVSTVTVFSLYLNHAMNFILYCVSGQMFRKELRNLFACRFKATRERSSMFSDFSTRTMRLSESSATTGPDPVRIETESHM